MEKTSKTGGTQQVGTNIEFPKLKRQMADEVNTLWSGSGKRNQRVIWHGFDASKGSTKSCKIMESP